MNTDNDGSRRMVEQCYRTNKTLLNPIIDWSARDVWSFLKEVRQVESCSLYAEGWERIGCIGCPLAGANRWREFSRWPKYKGSYLNAFDRMLAERAKRAKETDWRTAEEVFDWWMEVNALPGQMRIDDFWRMNTNEQTSQMDLPDQRSGRRPSDCEGRKPKVESGD